MKRRHRMSVISRRRWRMSIPLALILLALIASLVFALSSRGFTHAVGSLIQISSDPFTNTTSNHKTEVEPDTFAFGNTIFSAFHQRPFSAAVVPDIAFPTPPIH